MIRKHLSLVENKSVEKPEEFVVRCTESDEELYWSNGIGWSDLASAERFTKQDKQELRLPMDGEWVSMTEMREAMERHPVNHRAKPTLRLVTDETSDPKSE
jgi:hypothetical protein